MFFAITIKIPRNSECFWRQVFFPAGCITHRSYIAFRRHRRHRYHLFVSVTQKLKRMMTDDDEDVDAMMSASSPYSVALPGGNEADDDGDVWLGFRRDLDGHVGLEVWKLR